MLRAKVGLQHGSTPCTASPAFKGCYNKEITHIKKEGEKIPVALGFIQKIYDLQVGEFWSEKIPLDVY